MPNRVFAALAAASFGWGLAAVGVRYAFESGASTFTVIGVRLGAAALAVSAFAALARRTSTAQEWRRGSVIGIPRIALGPILFIGSLQYISAGVEAILITLIPVATALMAWVFLGERQGRIQLIGFAIALAGALVIISSGDSGLGAGEGDPLLGGLLALCGVVTAAISGVLQRQWAPHHETLSLAVPMFITGGTFAFAVALLAGDFKPGDLDGQLWVLLIALGLGSTLLPFVMTLFASKFTTAARVSLVAYVAPLISVAGGIVLLDEVLTGRIITGGLLSLTGVLLAGSGARKEAGSVNAGATAAGVAGD